MDTKKILSLQSQSRKVLLVDDELDLLETFVDLLAGIIGWEVITANDGKKALNLLRNDPHINLLISDVWMPELNGIDLVRQVRTFREKEVLEIILMTGSHMEEAKDLTQQGIIQGNLDKPFGPMDLLRLL